MDGAFRVVEKSPRPSRKKCNPKDIASYQRVCEMEGVLFLVQDGEATA